MKIHFCLCLVLCSALMTASCAVQKPTPKEPPGRKAAAAGLDRQINTLIRKVRTNLADSPYSAGKVLIVAGSLKKGERFSRLEEYIIDTLKTRLRSRGIQKDKRWTPPNEFPLTVAELCREDWIPLKEGNPPLSVSEGEAYVVLETSLTDQLMLDKVIASVSAYTFRGKHGKFKAEKVALFGDHVELSAPAGSLARRLFNAKGRPSLPSGCEENPYSSLEELAYGLVSEVLEKYPSSEIGVIDINGDYSIDRRVLDLIRQASEEYLTKNNLRIGVSKEAYRKAAEQITWYHKHMIFKGLDPKEHPFSPATVYILVDVRPGIGEESSIRASLKALWLASSDAGTYIEGLMAIAYGKAPSLSRTFDTPLEASLYELGLELSRLPQSFQGSRRFLYIEPFQNKEFPLLANYASNVLSDCLTKMGFPVVENKNNSTVGVVKGDIDNLEESIVISARVVDVKTSQYHTSGSVSIDRSKVPESLMKSPPQDQLEFRVNFLRYRKGELPEPIEDGDVLYSGDYYSLYFQPDQKSYVYIFQRDSADKIQQLFPMKRFKEYRLGNVNPVYPGETYYIPSPDLWFRLDRTTGKETIYFLASERPLRDLEKTYKALAEAREGGAGSGRKDYYKEKLYTHFKSRGMAGIERVSCDREVRLPGGKKYFVQLRGFEQQLRGTEAAFMRTLWFYHQ